LGGVIAQPATGATITVNTTSDQLAPGDGAVSLREAITAIDAGGDLGDPDLEAAATGTFGVADEIVFAIPAAAGIPTIGPSAALPAVTKPLTIDARTEAGAAAAPVGGAAPPVVGVTLNGRYAGGANGLVARAPLALTGLGIRQFGGSGVLLDAGSTGSSVAGNVIAGNGGAGVSAASAGDTVSENSITGNAAAGIATVAGGTLATLSLDADYRTAHVTFSGATPLAPVTAELYDNPGAPGCPGEGTAFIGVAVGPADPSGSGTVALTLPAVLPSRDGLTATVTDPGKGTSPFACLAGGVPARPGLSSVELAPAAFAARRGTTLSLTVTEAALVSIRITRTIHGHRVDHACVASGRRGRRCTRTSLAAELRFTAAAGANRFPLRVANLSPGRYGAVVSARDAANLTSLTVPLTLRIKR
jgi:hypothetical protein